MSDKHEIKTLEVNKLALNSQDDKRIWIDLIATLWIITKRFEIPFHWKDISGSQIINFRNH